MGLCKRSRVNFHELLLWMTCLIPLLNCNLKRKKATPFESGPFHLFSHYQDNKGVVWLVPVEVLGR